MGRIRSIKPEFPLSETTGNLSRDARLLFIQLWTIVDDEGRSRAASRMLASLLYPYDDDARDLMDGWLTELERNQCIRLYEVDGSTYLEIVNWLKHQKIDHASKSRLPEFREGSRGLAPDLGPRIMDQDLGSKEVPELRSDAPTPANVSRETKSEGKHLLPDDWLPKPEHYALARSKNISDAAVNDAVLEMRSWSKGNGEKRKNWDWVFNNWLTRNAKNGQRGSRPLQDDSKSISAAAGRLAEAAKRGEFTFGPRPSLLPGPDETPVFLLSKG